MSSAAAGLGLASGLVGAIGSAKAGRQAAAGYNAAAGAMAPYAQQGQNAMRMWDDAYNNTAISNPFQFNASNLEATPGYQFTLNQGLKAAQNSAAARGLGYSGAQMRGAGQFATGLAQQTYNDEYNRQLNAFNVNQQQAFNRLGSLQNMANMGAGAAGNMGNMLAGAGNARAQGTAGVTNSLSGALSGLGAMGMYSKMFGM